MAYLWRTKGIIVMRVILNLEKAVLDKLEAQANKENRSRKNYMETVLENTATGVKILDATKPTQGFTDLTAPPPTTNYEISIPQKPKEPLSQIDIFKQEISQASSRDELNKVLREIKKEPLQWFQKRELELFADEVMIQKGFIFND